MGYLFMHGPGCFVWGGALRCLLSDGSPPKIEQADRAVVAVFMGLQNAWRRQGTLRRTFDGMPSSQEEREGWKQLIQHLTQLPPLRR